MKRIGLTAATILIAGALLSPLALAQNYVFGPNIRVNEGPPVSYFSCTYAPGQHLIAARGDTVYFVWRDDRDPESHVFFSRSTDGGQNFSPNLQIDHAAGGGIPSLAVDIRGVVHVSWLNLNEAGSAQVYYSRSTNGGTTFSWPIRAGDSLPGTGPTMSSMAVSRAGQFVYVVREEGAILRRQVLLSRSTDGGLSFLSPDVRVNSDTNQDVYEPVVAVFGDSTVLAAWTDASRYPTGYDVYVARSTDAGASFGPAFEISDTPVDTSRAGSPSICADREGRVYAVFQTNIRSLGLAISLDSGRTFRTGLQIPQAAGGDYLCIFCTTPELVCLAWEHGNFSSGRGFDVRFAYSTDYGSTFSSPVDPSNARDSTWELEPSVAANEQGRVFMAWTDDRYGPLSLNYDVFVAAGTRSAIHEVSCLRNLGPALDVRPNPVRDHARITFSLHDRARVRLRLTDVTGRTVASLADDVLEPGCYHQDWDVSPAFPCGIYFLEFRTPGYHKTQKLILTR